jgi:transcription termination/antitermination protein NusG
VIAQNLQSSLVQTGWPDGLPDQSRGMWFVLHTRSRQEKAVAEDLSARRISCFLPLVRQVRYYGRRKALVDEPLFPGYIFLRGVIEQAYTADRSRRIAGIIRVHDQQWLDWELKNLYIALRAQAPLDPFPYLKRGVRVEVRSGPFRGLQGLVEDRLKIDRILLQVNMLGRGVSLEVDGALVEPLDLRLPARRIA